MREDEISDQDAHIAGFILEAGRAMVVAVNKWDGLDELSARGNQDQCRQEIVFSAQFCQLSLHFSVAGQRPEGTAAVDRRGVWCRDGEFADPQTDPYIDRRS